MSCLRGLSVTSFQSFGTCLRCSFPLAHLHLRSIKFHPQLPSPATANGRFRFLRSTAPPAWRFVTTNPHATPTMTDDEEHRNDHEHLSEALLEEISALNCIYQSDSDSNPQCLTGPLPPASTATPAFILNINTTPHDLQTQTPPNPPVYSDKTHHLFLLQPPDLPVPITFKIAIPHDYPGGKPPEVLSLLVGQRGQGDTHSHRGTGETWLSLAQDVMRSVYNGEEVCLYEFVEGMKEVLPSSSPDDIGGEEPEVVGGEGEGNLGANGREELQGREQDDTIVPDRGWVLSNTVMEKKSTFVARACHVSDPAAAKRYVQELILGDKKLQRATHNMYAYRITKPGGPAGGGEVLYQDNDDDGEAAAGTRLAHLLSVMGVVNVLVVVSRWYGGVKLGGDRFRIIGSVGREAVVRLLEQEKAGGEGARDKDGKEKGKGGGGVGGGKRAKR